MLHKGLNQINDQLFISTLKENHTKKKHVQDLTTTHNLRVCILIGYSTRGLVLKNPKKQIHNLVSWN